MMKKIVTIIGIAILLVILIPPSHGAGEKIKVVATLQIFSTIAQEIGKDMVDVDYIVPQGTDIHDYSLTQNDLVKIENANLIVLAGSNYFSIDREIKENSQGKILDFDDYNATLLTLPGFGTDFHGYWLYPQNAIKIADAIKDSLISLDPNNGKYYTTNFEKFENQIKKTMDYMANMEGIFDLKNKTALLAVPGVFYIVKALNISVWGSIVRGPNQFISGNEMNEVKDEIKAGKIDFIVNVKNLENTKAGEIAMEISKETGIKVLYIDVFSCENYTKLLIEDTAIISSYEYSETYRNAICDYTPYIILSVLLSVLVAISFYLTYRYRRELLK